MPTTSQECVFPLFPFHLLVGPLPRQLFLESPVESGGRGAGWVLVLNAWGNFFKTSQLSYALGRPLFPSLFDLMNQSPLVFWQMSYVKTGFSALICTYLSASDSPLKLTWQFPNHLFKYFKRWLKIKRSRCFQWEGRSNQPRLFSSGTEPGQCLYGVRISCAAPSEQTSLCGCAVLTASTLLVAVF